MSEDSLNLYVEEVYTEEDKTVILLETSNETQNLIIEEEVRKVTSIDGQPPNRSFLKLIIPIENYHLELQEEEWHLFPISFFSNVTLYIYLNDNDIGSNLIRSKLYFNNIIEEEPIKISDKKYIDTDYFTVANIISENKQPNNSQYSQYLESLILLTSNTVPLFSKKQKNKLINSRNLIPDTINYLINNTAHTLLHMSLNSLEDRVRNDFRIKSHLPSIADKKTSLLELRNKLKTDLKNSTPNSLKIINCTHGNWNEIITDNGCYFYDIGASLWLSKQKIDTFAAKKFKEPLVENIDHTLIISHWDKDHYQSIFNINNDDLKKIKQFIAPWPNKSKLAQATIKRALLRIYDLLIEDEGNSTEVSFIEPTDECIDNEKFISKSTLKLAPGISLYLGCETKNVNNTGLILLVKGESKQAILPADHSWQQVDKVAEDLNPNKPLLIITPHHGGNAGKFDKIIKNLKKTHNLELCTSCDENGNSYKHPNDKLISDINSLAINHQRTDNQVSLPLGSSINYDL